MPDNQRKALVILRGMGGRAEFVVFKRRDTKDK